MDYVVLVKYVPDTTKGIPDSAWDREKGTLKRGNLEMIMNPLDKNALEMALQIRDYRKESFNEDGRMIVASMGPEGAKTILKSALAMGADEAVLVSDKAFVGSDTWATSYALSQAVRKIAGDFSLGEHLIFCGMQSIDGDTAQVPSQIAKEMDIPFMAYAKGFEFTPEKVLKITRIGLKGNQILTPKRYPALITVTNCNEPRLPKLKGIMAANKKEIKTWSAEYIGAEPEKIGLEGSKTRVVKIFSQPMLESRCKFVGGEDGQMTMEDFSKELKDVYAKGLPEEDLRDEVAEDVKKYKSGETFYKGELVVFIEHLDGEIHNVSLELLGKGLQLARQLDTKLCALLLGHDVAPIAEKLFGYGAEKVYLAEHPLLERFRTSTYSKVICSFVENHKPQTILYGATAVGRELAPAVAYKTDCGLTADCTELQVNDFDFRGTNYEGVLYQIRPALGGNIMATIVTLKGQPQMATVRPGVMDAMPFDPSRAGETVKVGADLSEADVSIDIEYAYFESTDEVDLVGANIIVSGGRGIGGPEGFDKYVRPLADVFSATFSSENVVVGSSRANVDAGWIDYSHQVGQTGKTVKPKIYFAVGISGAVQHLAGMQKSDIICAINKDPDAPIFRVARYGFVGKVEDVVPKLLESLKN